MLRFVSMEQSEDRAKTIVYMRSMFQDLLRYTGKDKDPSEVFADVARELSTATTKFAPMNSAHEGWAVIAEELDELWDEVKARTTRIEPVTGNKIPGRRDVEAMRKEAIQVAAMAIRFVIDVCDGGRGQK